MGVSPVFYYSDSECLAYHKIHVHIGLVFLSSLSLTNILTNNFT